MDRRVALKYLALAPLASSGIPAATKCLARGNSEPGLRLSTFGADITPPIGSPLSGGWIRPVEIVDDPLRALGVVMWGGDKPIVLCALDWIENQNSANWEWREALAAAAGTDVSHVAVQCIHQHNTPMGALDANQLALNVDASLQLMDPHFFREAVNRTAAAVKISLEKSRAITHIGTGQGRVEKVASTRRVMGPGGKVAFVRLSKCTDAKWRAAPEGVIDPNLKTLSFWNEEQPIAALHYYATHPMSYYGDGRVTSDFCGLAREQRQKEQPDVFQVYFNGCAGDITAGKYNDGSHAMRPILRDRIHAGMVAAWDATNREPVSTAEWSVNPVTLPPRQEEEFSEENQRHVLTNSKAEKVNRAKAAIGLSWLARRDKPVELSCLRLGKASVLHLPGEPFIDYQLFAQQHRPDEFVCVAGYGDNGMGYIPLRESYVQGGYEPTWSFVGQESEGILKKAIRKLLG